ncbi:hypothetical protein A237_016565 [Pseudomonas syringae pv. actinidifoliorum ICMP 18803]|uniref:Lipoprotein n=1 Tax=Pseudomonas syringae pv. actinidifoliorum ICMP 18803 TaxID=1194400 RepID=A0AAT9SBW5_PSESX|nr:hypothetical protein [Pseudomonas syringae pv. actinidiae]UYS79102.1 hypothetical protein A237_016565 [Pseudomonas syringae pv. actinidifoliorum ICMP 18803]
MSFAPYRVSSALAAGPIVILIGCLFNRLALDVGIRPRIQLQSIKADALFSNGKFPNVWAHGLVEFVTTHAQIAVGITCPDEPGQDLRYLGARFVCHRGLLRAALGGGMGY